MPSAKVGMKRMSNQTVAAISAHSGTNCSRALIPAARPKCPVTMGSWCRASRGGRQTGSGRGRTPSQRGSLAPVARDARRDRLRSEGAVGRSDEDFLLAAGDLAPGEPGAVRRPEQLDRRGDRRDPGAMQVEVEYEDREAAPDGLEHRDPSSVRRPLRLLEETTGPRQTADMGTIPPRHEDRGVSGEGESAVGGPGQPPGAVKCLPRHRAAGERDDDDSPLAGGGPRGGWGGG